MPWWLENNKKYFKHGVMIDYHSTDNSVEIINKICPTWEIRTTKTDAWDPMDEDNEMMNVEKEFSGYKMILTLTEFLTGKCDFSDKPTCYSIPTKRMVDTKPNDPPVYEIPLTEQKKDGYMARMNKYRYIHNHSFGDYVGAGRHKTNHETTPCNLVVWKYAYCPWTEEFIKRRLQFKKNMSVDHKRKGWGKQHKLNREELQEQYLKELKKI